MSKEELVGAYVQGRISRRMFVRGLVMAGVSVTAAVAYSDMLSATTAPPRRVRAQQYGGDQYGGDQYGGEGQAPTATAVTATPRSTG